MKGNFKSWSFSLFIWTLSIKAFSENFCLGNGIAISSALPSRTMVTKSKQTNKQAKLNKKPQHSNSQFFSQGPCYFHPWGNTKVNIRCSKVVIIVWLCVIIIPTNFVSSFTTLWEVVTVYFNSTAVELLTLPILGMQNGASPGETHSCLGSLNFIFCLCSAPEIQNL